jgi:hypothetical protein
MSFRLYDFLKASVCACFVNFLSYIIRVFVLYNLNKIISDFGSKPKEEIHEMGKSQEILPAVNKVLHAEDTCM